jgi:iron(III) transport system substrate-binding protein
MTFRTFLRGVLLLAVLPLFTNLPVRAASADDELIAKAKAEGKLVTYVSATTEQVVELTKRFEAAYGIPVEYLRLSAQQLPVRLTTEQRGGRYAVDAVVDPLVQMSGLKAAGQFAQYVPPEARDLQAGIDDKDGYYHPVFLKTEVLLYNPARVQAAGLKPPRDWSDLAAPEWRGKFGLAGDDIEWYAGLRRYFGKERADALLRSISANQPRLIESHTLGITLVGSGELLAMAAAYGPDALDFIRKGTAGAIVNPVPTILQLNVVAVMKTAPHPNAARLYVRWWLSKETQQWFLTTYHIPSSRKDLPNDPQLLNSHLKYSVASPTSTAEYTEDVQSFRSIFNIPG